MTNKKTLYITDLDGTLLDSRAELSEFTVDALKRLSLAGVNISVATARTAATVAKMFADIPLSAPAVLMNGVCVYSLQAREYVRAEHICDRAKREAIDIVARHGLSGFWYSVENNRLSTFYENTQSPAAESFIEERQRKYNKVFTRVDSFTELYDSGLLYYSISDREEKLSEAAKEFALIDGLRVEYYRDIYTADCMYLELCSAAASKSTAVDYLRESCGFEEVVGFGDNYNDLPLLEACDRFYAVENAVDELKRRANGVIGRNTDNAVARWLLKEAGIV